VERQFQGKPPFSRGGPSVPYVQARKGSPLVSQPANMLFHISWAVSAKPEQFAVDLYTFIGEEIYINAAAAVALTR
jgi:hypothetical protein